MKNSVYKTLYISMKEITDKSGNGSKPSGTPCPISRAFRSVCSNASVSIFTGEDPRTLTTWLLRSTSTFLTPECENVSEKLY